MGLHARTDLICLHIAKGKYLRIRAKKLLASQEKKKVKYEQRGGNFIYLFIHVVSLTFRKNMLLMGNISAKKIFYIFQRTMTKWSGF